MFDSLRKFILSWNTGGLSNGSGEQQTVPFDVLFDQSIPMTADRALQIPAVYACVDLYAKTIASLPIFVYTKNKEGVRIEDRTSRLWHLLHVKPNAFMSPGDFKSTVVVNFLLTGNSYIRIDRDASGEPFALWPLSSEQVKVAEKNGQLYYQYKKDGVSQELSANDVIHWKALGNGLVGISRIHYMRASLTEAVNAQSNASKLFGAKSKPAAILQTDAKLDNSQVAQIMERFRSMAEGGGSLAVVDRGLKYSPLSLSPAEAQLLQMRQFIVEEVCRWFGVPPVLIGASGATTWGSGIEQLKSGFHTFSLAPMCTQLQEALEMRLVGVGDDVTIEFNYDALLRASPEERAKHYSTMVQNGIMTRNECRHLENLPPDEFGDSLTAQSNLLPLARLGEVVTSTINVQGSSDGSTIKQ